MRVVRDIQAVRRQRGAVRLQTADEPFGPAVGGLYNHIWPPLLKKTYNRAGGARGKRKTAAIGSSPPLVPYGTTFPPQAGAQQTAKKHFPHKQLKA